MVVGRDTNEEDIQYSWNEIKYHAGNILSRDESVQVGTMQKMIEEPVQLEQSKQPEQTIREQRKTSLVDDFSDFVISQEIREK